MIQSTIKVLFIEDEPAEYSLLCRTVSKCLSKYEVSWARSVGEARELLTQSTFDVILSDLSLPDAFGLQTIEKIREIESLTAIVVLTSNIDSKIEAEAMVQGAQDFLIKKDLNPCNLEIAIKHAIHRQQCLERIEQLLIENRHQQQRLEDQTELLERKNKKLKKLYRTAHKFVDNVSHEFRTPLTVIKDYVSLVREGMVGPVNAEQQQMLDIAGVRADDLNNMVDDMLDVSKLQSGMLSVWRNSCQTKDIIHKTIPSLVQKAHVKKIQFEINVEENLPPIYCDEDKMSRVIINLVTNAMKFCGDPGKVTLNAGLRPETGELLVSVADNGGGIEPKQLKLIFRRFKQLRNSTKNSTKGFGLGLSIAKELVDLNLGEMNVNSEVGKGSTFSFTVPLADPPSIMRRYLDRFRRSSAASQSISLIETVVDDAVGVAEAEDLNLLFHYLLRQHDLMFRLDSRSWMMVIATPEAELEKYFARARAELQRSNRNRPRGQLPDFRMQTIGTWKAAPDREKIIMAFDQHFAEGAYVGQ
jgi:signal transduction histidine kinase